MYCKPLFRSPTSVHRKRSFLPARFSRDSADYQLARPRELLPPALRLVSRTWAPPVDQQAESAGHVLLVRTPEALLLHWNRLICRARKNVLPKTSRPGEGCIVAFGSCFAFCFTSGARDIYLAGCRSSAFLRC